MKAGLLIGLIVVMFACPPVSHGAGLLRYAFDAIYNQLGLDRGPIPKIPPKPPGPACTAPGQSPKKARYPGQLHIQAEGF
ncbi:hypothetical protein ACFL2Q_13465 [Thermodesulfobacteriota bacterium]